MFETHVAKKFGLPRNSALLCASVNNPHVRRAVVNNRNVYFERKVLLNEKWWEDKEKIFLWFLSQKTNNPVRL